MSNNLQAISKNQFQSFRLINMAFWKWTRNLHNQNTNAQLINIKFKQNSKFNFAHQTLWGAQPLSRNYWLLTLAGPGLRCGFC